MEQKRRGNPNWVKRPVEDESIQKETISRVVKVPGTVFVVDEDGYVKVTQELLDKLFNN